MKRLVTDTLIIAERNLIRLPRAPELLLAFTVQPIMFVLLFRYVFGGAIRTPGSTYVDFLIPGIITQNIAFGGFVTALGLNEDLHKGLIDRFRSLPMARAAVLAGRTTADIVTNFLSMTILVITGVIIGFSFHTNVTDILAGVVLLLFFGYAFSWVFAWLGLLVSTPEAANSIGFIVVFPLDVHLVRLRPGRLDARCAPVVRQDQSLHDRGRRHAGVVDRNSRAQLRLGGVPLVGRDPRDLRPARRRQVPAGGEHVSQGRPLGRSALAAPPA